MTDEEKIARVDPVRPWSAPPAPGELPEKRVTRNRGRRILWFRWYGFPRDARWHLAQIGKHLRSLLGLRP